MVTKRSVLVLGMLLTACAHRNSEPADPATVVNASRSSDVITAAELREPAVRDGDMWDAIQRLRPRFLTVIGSGSIRIKNAGALQVSVAGGPLMASDFLKRVRANEAAEVRYLSPTQAAQRFGTTAGTGSVILIKSR